MAESTRIKVKRDGTITFRDGSSPTPKTYTVAYEAGDLNITFPGPTVNVFLDRGIMGATPSLRYGDEQPMSFTFTANFRDTTDAAAATLMDILNRTGWVAGAGGWVSSLGANQEVFCVDLLFTIEGTDHGDAADHTLTLKHCALSGSLAEGDPNVLTINGTAFSQYPVVT
jgi:hypothetical protein